MTRMFSMIFVILFFFIMVLCAFQPICFANALEYSDYVITTNETDIYYSNCNLMLDKDTPLTLGYLRDNPIYVVYISSSGGNTPIQALRPNNTLCSLGNAQNGLIELNYTTNRYINSYYEQYGEEIWDYPIRVSTTGERITVYANKAYELSLLEKLAIIGRNVFYGSQTVMNFIVSTPLMLITCGLSLLGIVILIVKRVITVG